MNNVNPNQQADIICPCSGTRKEKIIQLIDNGMDNLQDISAATGVCSGCGSCDVLVMELIRDNIVTSPQKQ